MHVLVRPLANKNIWSVFEKAEGKGWRHSFRTESIALKNVTFHVAKAQRQKYLDGVGNFVHYHIEGEALPGEEWPKEIQAEHMGPVFYKPEALETFYKHDLEPVLEAPYCFLNGANIWIPFVKPKPKNVLAELIKEAKEREALQMAQEQLMPNIRDLREMGRDELKAAGYAVAYGGNNNVNVRLGGWGRDENGNLKWVVNDDGAAARAKIRFQERLEAMRARPAQQIAGEWAAENKEN